MGVSRNSVVFGKFVPEVTRTFLPGCRVCGGAHPLARRGYQGSSTHCPDCDAPSAPPGRSVTERAILSSWMGRIANLLLSIGAALGRMAGRF